VAAGDDIAVAVVAEMVGEAAWHTACPMRRLPRWYPRCRRRSYSLPGRRRYSLVPGRDEGSTRRAPCITRRLAQHPTERGPEMARGQFEMIDIVEVLQRWHAGRPKSVVASSVGIDDKTVRKYVAPAEAAWRRVARRW
jgi:hypothetical protein